MGRTGNNMKRQSTFSGKESEDGTEVRDRAGRPRETPPVPGRRHRKRGWTGETDMKLRIKETEETTKGRANRIRGG